MKDSIKKIINKRPRFSKRAKVKAESSEQPVSGVPRITNETVAEHREEVLSSARKYIYPLQHSAHRIVTISIYLFILVIITFFTYCLLALYKFQSSSTFLYRVTQIIPFPVAKADSRYVAYENYLFELRHYIHYYQTQQHIDFNSTSGKDQLAEFRKLAMQRVVDYAYIKKLAEKNNISVTDRELEDAIRLVRNQNRLGSNDQVFEDVLKEFWGWSVSDFKRELRQQMLSQKVVSTLDTASQQKANEAYQKIQAGEDFGTVAKKFSDDAGTKDNGGDYGSIISQSDRSLSPQVIDTLFKLEPGQVSKVINTGTSLEIIKLKQKEAGKLQAAHIVVNFKAADEYLKPLREKNAPHLFITQK